MAFSKKRSAKERQEYHFEQSRKGSYNYNFKTGEYKKNSDFVRGVHLGKAQMIQKQRMNSAKFFNRRKRREIAKVFNS